MIAPLLFVALVLPSQGHESRFASPVLRQTSTSSSAAVTVSGVVRDPDDAVVQGALVIVRTASGREVRTLTGPDGRFSLSVTAPTEIVVRAGGFAELKTTVAGSSSELKLSVVPASVSEAVSVTATKSEARMGDVPAAVTMLPAEKIKQTPAVLADDVLRQVPSFSLFRRTSSIVANPTSQGVSLRGIGPSGVSRTLVLLDGVPFNDPFGGWVYWSRIPIESAERIEVVEGTNSSLYGNYAMGGVINVITERATPKTVEFKTQYGSLNSPSAQFSASDVWGKLGIRFDGAAYDTDGYKPVAPSEQGIVDNNANVNFKNGVVKADYAASDRLSFFVRSGYFREKRANGKASTVDGTEEANDTRWASTNGGMRLHFADGSELDATVSSDIETFHSNFLAVPAATPPRSIGRMSLLQTVPTHGVSTAVQWSRPLGRRQFFTAGVDWRHVDGDSQESGLDATTGTSVILQRVSGGTQRNVGVFAQDILTPTDKLTITLSARGDSWRNYDAHNLETNYPSGTPTANNAPSLPDRDDSSVSPHAAALYHLTSQVSVWGDIGSGFRAPTLNELYRQFRQGSVLTLPNNQLGPERLIGGEAGVMLAPASRLSIRSTWFDNHVSDAIANITVSQSGANITRQRQNLQGTHIWGVQTDAQYQIATMWTVNAAYVYDNAKVAEVAAGASPDAAALVGKYLPQVPTHRGTVQVAYANPKLATIAVSVLAMGRQFDDDQNAIIVPGQTDPGLPKYAVVDLLVSRDLAKNFQIFAGAQNLFNQVYYAGTLPTLVGSPRIVSGGLRVKLQAR